MPAGRYAPSPSGDLHVGNLRTAVLAWLFARASNRDFLMRVDDLDRVREGAAERQLSDLAALGLTWSNPVVYQSDRIDVYRATVDRLTAAGLTYECFCTRREIQDAPTAPHHPPGSYPGTCRSLSEAERAERRRHRPAALRLRSEESTWQIDDMLHGAYSGAIDDFVLRRGDGIPAYNLTVVIDDGDAGVDQVVRGDDLLASTPRQAYLTQLLGYAIPEYVHVPLVLNANGARLAKRDGAVTLTELTERGTDVLSLIGTSLDLPGSSVEAMLEQFDPQALPREPWVFEPPD